MAFRLHPSQSVDAEVRRVAGELLEDAVHRLRNDPPSVEDIHKSRTDLKRLRSLARLASIKQGTPNRVARDAASRLSAQRDHAVMAVTFESLVPELSDRVSASTVLRVRAGLASAAAALRRSEGGAPVERAVADDLDALALAAAMWKVDGRGFGALEDGLRESYARGRRALEQLESDPHAEELHELRKRVKDHWYHLRLLRDTWPRVADALIDEAHALADDLGDDHDLWVLEIALSGEGPDLLGHDRDVVLGAIADRRAALVVAIGSRARRVYADKPGAFTRRLGRWWSEACRYP